MFYSGGKISELWQENVVTVQGYSSRSSGRFQSHQVIRWIFLFSSSRWNTFSLTRRGPSPATWCSLRSAPLLVSPMGSLHFSFSLFYSLPVPAPPCTRPPTFPASLHPLSSLSPIVKCRKCITVHLVFLLPRLLINSCARAPLNIHYK